MSAVTPAFQKGLFPKIQFVYSEGSLKTFRPQLSLLNVHEAFLLLMLGFHHWLSLDSLKL